LNLLAGPARLAVTLRALCILGFLLGGCEREPRIPYIPPTLANWPQPHRGVPGLKIHVFNSGTVRIRDALLLRGGSLTRMRELPVPVFVIEHPKEGLILFNSGLPAEIPKAAAGWLSWLGVSLGAEVVPGEALPAQLRRAGLSPDRVRWIVFSTLRFDHTGGATRFPKAHAVVAKAEHEYALSTPASEVASDVEAIDEWKLIDFEGAAPLATFPAHVDLFGDGSCLLIDVSGSTPGTLAMLVRLSHQAVFLADDLAPVEESVRYALQPVSAYDAARWWDHIWRLKRFKDLVPELIVVPGHDLGPVQRVHVPEIIVHESHVAPPTPRATPTPGALQRVIPRPL